MTNYPETVISCSPEVRRLNAAVATFDLATMGTMDRLSDQGKLVQVARIMGFVEISEEIDRAAALVAWDVAAEQVKTENQL